MSAVRMFDLIEAAKELLEQMEEEHTPLKGKMGLLVDSLSASIIEAEEVVEDHAINA